MGDAASGQDGRKAFIEAFARLAPRAVARRLELAEVAAATEVLRSLSAPSGASALATLPAAAAARLISSLPVAQAAPICEKLEAPMLAAILRCMDAQRSAALLEGLSAGGRRAVAPLLSFADDRAGAHVDPHVLSFRADSLVADVLATIRQQPERAADQLFITGADHVLVGSVDWRRLLTAAPTCTLAELMSHTPQSVSSGLLLADAATHPGWAQARTLPVTDAQMRLLGGLHYAALPGAEAGGAPADASKAARTARELGELMSLGVSALWQWTSPGGSPERSDP